ncbi:MAG: 8-oxoguanine deaminase [Armatimonadota bacterium]|nr:8-oxoguanine deaminase [Armatimonadota bacterium]MDR7485933.1 8-oxoguanine deaminase [Armatimonadota bacterium]MDR7533116.1 8-oxoguanine deaminase [Armatimonadota bacterium]MDR7536638.1 8-oxoguanine deaminase [Armatimonadota bacterium]
MGRLLIEECDVVVTMDDAGTEIPGGSILADDGAIVWVGAGAPPAEVLGPSGADTGALERLDGRGCVALPGLVNAHHHLYQTLTRACATDRGLFGWLRLLYPIWAGLDAAWVYAAARVGLAELATSGCATTTDHHYVFPAGSDGFDVLEAEIAAARELGVRFHPCRGAMDLGASRGGLPPDEIVQDTDEILAQIEAAVRRYHQRAPGAMLQMAIAPCSPFSVTPRLMQEAAAMARRLGVRLHTHIAETRDEDDYCVQRFGRRPLELLDAWGWLGGDVWLAHCVHVGAGAARLGATQTGAAWCPTSNLRLGSGIAPARALLEAGVPVGLGVDGSASNDSGSLIAEARMGLLVSRAAGERWLDAREVLRIATRGGAACLGRDDIGALTPGRRADVALFSVSDLAHTGGERDPVAALVYCAPGRVKHLLVDGRAVVRDFCLVTADEVAIAAEGRRVSRAIWTRAGSAVA